jgi:hypothetical protein
MSMYNLTSEFLLSATQSYSTVLHPNIFHWITILITGQHVFNTLANMLLGSVFAFLQDFNFDDSIKLWK